MFHLMRRLRGRGSKIPAGAARGDAGSALLVVMSAAAILFVTAAAVVGIVVFQQAQQARAQAVIRATGLAHQGMEVYLTALRIDPNYRTRVRMIAGIGEDGTWTVAADTSQNTITAVGHDRRSGLYHVIRATVTAQNFSGYTIISGSPLTLGNAMGGIDIQGAVRGNATIDLRQSFPNLTVEYASGRVINSGNALSVTKVSPIDFAKAGSTYPNMYTAASTREDWNPAAPGVQYGDEIRQYLTKPLSFYREPNSGQNYWGATSSKADRSAAGVGDQAGLVGVGIDFSKADGADPSSGLFYVRSMWTPSLSGLTRDQYLALGATDPVWNPGRFFDPEIGAPTRSYEITPRGLDPNGNNVIYVGGDYDVYVTGEYSRSVTIVSERNIYIIGSLTRSTDPAASPTATLGLVAKGNIYICGSMPMAQSTATYAATGQTYVRGQQSDPRSKGLLMGDGNLTIQAAMLSVNGAIIMDPRYPDPTDTTNPAVRNGTLKITGSLAAAEGLQGPNFANDYDPQYGGFKSVEINYDNQLQDTPPPLFPQLGAGSLKISGWEEYTSTTDPNAGLSFPEPLDYRPESPVPATSSESTYTPSGTDFVDPITRDNHKDQYLGQAVITLTAVDLGVGVGETWYSVDGGPINYGYTIEIPSPPANTAETHTVDYASVDKDGNREPTQTVTFRTVGPDTLPPTTVVRDSRNPTMTLPDGYPQQGDPDYVVYGDFNPVFTATDNAEGSGAYQIIVIQKNDPQHVSGYTEADPAPYVSGANEDLLSPLRYDGVRVTRDVPGFITRQFEYYAIDAAGNREQSKTLTIVQHAPDVTKPITFFDIQQLYIGQATLHLSGVDDIEGQGFQDTFYSLDGGAWTRSTANPTTITVAAPYLGQPQMTHTISFYSRDKSPAQNTEETQTVSFIVAPPLPDDLTPPVTKSDAQPSYIGPAVITLYPTDSGGISAVYWRLDGGETQSGTRIEVNSPWTGADDHTLEFWAVDLSGNVEHANTVNFEVTPERTAPVSAAHNLDLYNGPAVFQITAEDNQGGSGLVGSAYAGTYYKIDNGDWQLGVPVIGSPGLTWVAVTGDGLHTVTYYSEDNAQNKEAPKTATFRIDSTPPTTTDNNTGSYVGQASVSLSATDSWTPGGSTEATAGSGVKTTYWRNKADGLVHASNTVLLGTSPTGGWDITYWSVDNAGNIETDKSMHIVVTEAPDVTAPVSYDEITKYYKYPAPAQLNIFSWDVQTGVGTLYYKVDGGATLTMPGKDNPPAFYQVLVGIDGTHTVEYWASDKAPTPNVESPHKTATFVLDTVFPVTTTSASLRQGAIFWADQTFPLTAVDIGTGVRYTYYTLDGGVPIRGTSVYVPAPTDGYSRSHTIRYWSVDVAGNVESAHSVTFTSKPADTTPPKTYSNAQDNYDGASTIVLTAFDNLGGSGVAHTYYMIDNGPTVEGTLVGVSGSGAHTLEFWSVDAAGNIESPHNSVTYNIDQVAPTTTSDARDLYNAPASIHLTAADNAGGSGVRNTYYRLDGGVVTTGTAPLTTILVSTEGAHSLEFWSDDVAGNVETHKTKTFKIDMTPPVTTSNAQASYAGTATIILAASDEASGSGVAYTRYRIDLGVVQSGTTVMVPPPTAGTASHAVTFWSVDNAGNVETQKTVNFTCAAVANIAFSGMTPAELSTITVRNPLVSVTGQADQKITTITATIDGNPAAVSWTYGGGYWVSQGYWVPGHQETDGCTTWWVDPYWVDTSYYVPVDYTRATASFGASGLLNGPHTVSFVYTNLAGATAIKTWSFSVNAPADSTPPVTTSDALAFYSSTATISLTATDGVGNTDVANTYYILDGGARQTGTPPKTTVVVSAAGSHTLEFWSVDGAGNIETPHKSANFNIDSVAPVTYAGTQSSYAGTATVYLAPTDNPGGSGVKYTYYRLDGGPLSVPTLGSGTLAQWHFDEGTGTALADSGPNGYAGTLSVGSSGSQASVAQAWANGANGRFATAMSFDGTDDYVNVGSRTLLNSLGDTFSVAAWVKTSSSTGTHIIAGRSNDWWLAKSGNSYQFAMWTTTASYSLNATNTSTDWVYVVATYDTNARQMRLYLNGSLAAAATVSGPTRRSYTQNQIGNGCVWHTGGVYSNDCYWSGLIDEVVISNVARSPEDIASYYSATQAGNVVPLQLPVNPPLSGGAVPHTVQYYSVDNAGNVEATKSVGFSVSMPPDNTPPTTTHNIASPYSKPATITLTAVDNVGGWGVANTYYRVDNNATQTGSGVYTGGAGGHTLLYWSVDAAGNVESAKTATYTVLGDTIKPVTTCNALSFYIGPAAITLSASDVGWGVANTYYKLDNNATQTGTAISVDAPIAGVVHHTLLYWSVDYAGNVEDTKASYFDVYAIPYPMTYSDMYPVVDGFTGSTNPTVSVKAKADQNIVAVTATLDGISVPVTYTAGAGYWVYQGYWVPGHLEGDGCTTWWVDTYYVDTSYWVAGDPMSAVAKFPTSALAVGPHNVVFTFTVASGAQGVKAWTFTVDTIPPTTVSDMQPSYIGTATINLTATDNSGGSGVNATYFRVDSGPNTTGTVIVTTPPPSGSVSHTISYWSVDNVGNPETVKTQTYQQQANPDVTPPTTTSNAATSYPSPSMISLTATDNVGGWGVADTFYVLDGGAVTTGTAPLTQVGTGGGGVHTLQFWSTDKAGNREATKSVTYTVTPDTTSPTIVSNAQPFYIGQADITITATDTAGGWGVRDVNYQVDGGTTVTVTSPWYTVTVMGPFVGTQTHSLTFWAYDRAGNRSSTVVASFTIQAAPAPVTFSNFAPPKSGTTQSVNPTVSVFGSTLTTITGVTATLDGVTKIPIITYSKTTTGSPGHNESGTADLVSSFVGIDQHNDPVMRWGPDWFGASDPNVKWTCQADFNLTPYAGSTISNAWVSWGFATTGDSNWDEGQRKWVAQDNGTALQYWSLLTYPSATSAGVIDTYVNAKKTSGTVRFVWDSDYGQYYSTWDDGPWGIESGMSAPTLHFTYSGWVVGNQVTVDDLTKATASIPTTGLSQGWHSASFTYTVFNGSQATTSWNFCVDNIAPVTTSNVQSAYTGSAYISLTATDGPVGSGVYSTMYKIDGGTTQYGTSFSVGAPLSSTTTHTVQYWSVDNAGNVENATTKTFAVTANYDGTPPEYLYCDVQPYYSAPGTITITATDAGWGIRNIYYIKDGTTVTVAAGTTKFSTGGVGTHTLEYWADDLAGNATTHRYATYIVDMTPPSTMSDIVSTYTAQANITLTATDGAGPGVSGVNVTYYKLDNGSTTYNYYYVAPTLTIAGPASGVATHTLEYWSVDRAGNTESPHKVQNFAIVAQQAPMIWSNITPPENSTVIVRNPTVAITGQAQANITGVTAVLDGVAKTPTISYATTTTTAQVWVSSGYWQDLGTQSWYDDGCGGYWVENYAWVDTSHYVTQTATVTDYTCATATFPTTNLQDGTHTVTFTYTVAGGAQAYKTWQFVVNGPDNVPPVTTPIYSSSYAGTATVTLVATDNSSGVKYTYYKVDTGAVQYGTPPTSTIYVTAPQYGSAISHTIYFWSVDNLDNSETTKSITFTVAPAPDTLPPVTTSNAVKTYTGTANISLTATDNPGGWGVATTYYKVDGGTTIAGTSIVISAPQYASLDHSITFWSVDRAGNVETANVATFTVNALPDTTPPSTSSNALTVYSAPSTITLTPFDAGWGVAGTFYILDGGVISSGTVIPTGGQASHVLQFWSVDRAGNKETTKTVAYVVDQTAPITTSNATTSYASTATITLAATDSHPGGSGVRYTYFKVDGGVQTTGTTIVVTGPKSGPPVSHTILFWSVDYAGNVESPAKSATFTVTPPPDSIPPTTYSNAVAFYATPSTISLTATDNIGGWGVAHTYYILDGGGQIESTSVPTGGNGQHSLEFWSVDWAGNIETPHKTVAYNVDMVAPTTTSNAVASYTGTATISLTATDNALGSGVKATYFKLDASSSTTGTVVVVPPPGYSSVVHTLQFWSVDNMGNTEVQKTATFTVNALADTVAPVSASNAVANYARPATITITATDNAGGWGIDKIYYSRDGATAIAGYTAATGNIMSASCGVNTGLAGNHTLEFWAVDKAGNAESAHHTVSYYVVPDTTAPVTISNVVGLYIGPATISLTATDNGGWGVDKTYYKVDDTTQTVGTTITVGAPIAGSVVHNIKYWSVDLAGNVEVQHSETFTVSGIPANVTFSGITPPDGSTITTGWVNIGITGIADQNIASATLLFDGVKRAANVSISGMQGTVTWNATGLTDGNHTVSVIFQAANGQQATKTWSFTVAIQTDFTPPNTTSNAVLAYIGVANITLVATDNVGGTGVKYTYYKLDSGSQQTGTLVTVNGPASGAPVSHTLYFWSVDWAGNVETTRSATFSVAPPDTTAPHSTSDAKLYYAGPSWIQLSATDNVYGAGVAHIYYRLDGASTIEGTLLGTGGVGTHVLEFWAVDAVGNVETPHNTVTYKVDSTAPVTTSDAALSYVGTAYVNLFASDEVGGSGVKDTYYRIDDGWQTSGTTVTVPPPSSGAVQHSIYFWSVDNAGNVETTKSASFTVAAPPDTTPPTTTSDAKATYAVPGLIKLTATDNIGGWGVDHTYYKLDGGIQTEGTDVRTGAAGSHTLEFWSVDKASNVESPHQSVTYGVTANDVTPPLTSTDATSTYIGKAVISLTATDNCGVLPVTYYVVDSGAATTGTVVTVLPPRSASTVHTLYYRSVDLNGNSEATKSVTFTQYAQAASMTFSSISPTEGTTIAIRNPVVTIKATSLINPIVDAQFALDGVTRPSLVTISGQVATMTYPASGLTNGGHTITATFIDSAGAVSTWSWTFTVNSTTDITAPSTTCDAASYYNGAATVHLYSADDPNGMGLAGTYYKLDGGSQLTGNSGTTTITVAAAGNHTLEYWSVDLAGNQELPHKTVTFNIDTQAPSTTSNAGNAYTGTAVITLTPTDNTNGSGIAATYYIVDTGAKQTGTVVSVPAPSSGSQLHKLYFWSVDNAGNVEATRSVTFNVWAPGDVTPPVTASDAQTAYSVPGIIHLTATDVGGWGVAHTYYIFDGGAQTEGTIVGTGGAGNHSLEFWSVDLAGNIETPHNTVSYSVIASDTTPPVTSTDATSTYNGPAVINLTATDVSGSGVAHTYYRIDGGTQTEGTIVGVSGAGAHQVMYWSVDWAGNIEAAKYINLTIVMPDVTPPITTTNIPTSGSYIGTATISLIATDNAGGVGVRTTFYRLDGGPVQQGTTIVVAPPVAGTVSHTLEYWSVDNNGNTEGSKYIPFSVSPVPDVTPPVTTSNGIASYAGTATITLTAVDPESGVKATYFKLDAGPVTMGTVVTIAPPVSGSQVHNLYFWSVNNQNGAETTKTLSFTVNSAAPWTYATLSFRWEPGTYSTAKLHVENAARQSIVSTTLAGYGNQLDWDVQVPAGQNYYMVCDSYTGVTSGGGYGTWTYDSANVQNAQNPLQNSAIVTWWY